MAAELRYTVSARDANASKTFERVGKSARTMGRQVSDSGAQTRKAAGSFGMFAGVAAGLAAATGGVAVGLKSVIGAASDLNETVSKTQQVFGASSAEVMKFAENSATSLGMSRQAALNGLSTFGNFFSQIRVGRADAVRMSQGLVQLSTDLGSFHNADPTAVMESFASATRGEYDALQKFIPTVNAASIQTEALRLTHKKSAKELTLADKATALYTIAQRDAGKAAGDFARTSGNAANQSRILKAQLANQRAELGQKLLPVWTGLLKWLNGTALPGLSKLGKAIGDELAPKFKVAAGEMRKLWAVSKDVFGFLERNQDVIIPLAAGLASAAAAWKIYAVAMAVATAAQAAFAAVSAAGGIAALFNPVGLAIALIVGLGVALVVAYRKSETFRKFVDAMWKGIVAGAMWAWNSVLKPTFDALVVAFQKVGEGAKWLWTNAIQPAIGFIVGAFQVFMLSVKMLWQNVLSPVFSAIAAAANFLWANVFHPVLSLIGAGFKALGVVIRAIWTGVLWPVLKAVAAVAWWLWTNAISLVWIRIQQGWRALVTNLRIIWENVLKPVFNAIAMAAGWLWQNGIRPALDAIRGGWNVMMTNIRGIWENFLKPVFVGFGNVVTGIKNAFVTNVNIIRDTWAKLKNYLREPVKWVIDHVINPGVIDPWNWISKYALAGKFNIGRFKFADGGVMPGYTPGRDVALAALSGGEAIMRPEWTRAIGPEQINEWNRLAKAGGTGAVARAMGIPGYADGGIFDKVKALGAGAWNLAKTSMKGVGAFLANPAGYLAKAFSGALGKLATARIPGVAGEIISGLPKLAITRMIDAAKAWVFGSNPAATVAPGGGAVNLGSGANSIGAILAMAQRFYPGARLSSGFRPGDPGYHGRAMAADLIGGGASGMAQIARGFYGMSGRLLELIHSGGGGFFVKNGQRVGANYYRSAIAGHYNHVHVAANRSALMDKGGWLMPGRTIVDNNTGRPERVLPPGARDVETVSAPIVIKLDSRNVYEGLLTLRRRLGGGWELA